MRIASNIDTDLYTVLLLYIILRFANVNASYYDVSL